MDWSYMLLGLLQGITEFLPISSSGHLFAMERVLDSDQLSLSFVLLLHVATFLSVLAVFHKEIKSFIFGFQEKNNHQLFFKLLVSLSPLLFVGLFFKSFVEQGFEKNIVAFGFFGSGLILITLFFIKTKKLSLKEMNFFSGFSYWLGSGFSCSAGLFPLRLDNCCGALLRFNSPGSCVLQFFNFSSRYRRFGLNGFCFKFSKHFLFPKYGFIFNS